MKLDDGTPCRVKTSTASQITCELGKFYSIDSAKEYKVVVTVNGVAKDNLTIKQVASVPGTVGIVPFTASPVLHISLTITVSGGTLIKGKTYVNLVEKADETKTKPLYVTKVDAFKKEIKVKFGGAVSGKYKLVVSTDADGRLDDGALNF